MTNARLWNCNFVSCIILCLVSAECLYSLIATKSESCHLHFFTHGTCKVPSLNLVGEKVHSEYIFLELGFDWVCLGFDVARESICNWF